MSLSRRKFIKAGFVAATCAAFPLKSALGQKGTQGGSGSSSMTAEQLNYYTQSTFIPYVNTEFSVYLSPSDTRQLKLVEVTDYFSTLPPAEAQANQHMNECFSLLLTVPPDRPFEQDTYLIEHAALGKFYMFMVPVGEQGKKALDYYEAVIYRYPLLPKGYVYVFNNNSAQPPTTPVPLGRVAGGVVIGPPALTAPPVNRPQPEIPADGRATPLEVFYFRPQAIESHDVSVKREDPGTAGRRAAAKLTVAQSPDIGGLKLGMTVEQVLALFPGIKDNAEIRSRLSKPPSQFGEQSLVIHPGKYSTKQKFGGVSQIILTFLDGRVSTLYVGYAGEVWEHVDGFVEKFSGETNLPGADSWDAYAGMETQLKTLRCRDFEVSLFAGGDGVNINYVQIRDMAAQQKLKGRRARAIKMNGAKP